MNLFFKKPLVAVWLFVLCSLNIFAAFENDTSKFAPVNKIDEAIQSSKSLKTNQPKVVILKPLDYYPDIYFEYRIEQLNKVSPIKLDYNQDVRKYIELFTKERKDKIAVTLGLTELYFPIFEEYLDKYNLPLELKYLPIVESGLSPTAQSSSGAMGLWQLLFNTSKFLGLEVNSYVDERCDIYKSTDAACKYLKYLYSIFNDWQLALAAYNGGPGEVRNAIIRSGGKTDFWQIQPYLPEQTKWYVPSFIAAMYIAKHYGEHGITPVKPVFNYNDIDTISITEAVEFSRITEKTGISAETLKQLNPSYKRDYIPGTDEPRVLVLPSNKVSAFIKVENQIFSKQKYTPDYIESLKTAGDTAGLKKQIYIVGKGDFLHKIGLTYGCSTESIKAWNKLTSNNLNNGQKLVLWLPETITNKQTTAVKDTTHKTVVYYTVKKGDTIWGIAEKFNCDSIAELKALNNITNDKQLKPGIKLKILIPSTN